MNEIHGAHACERLMCMQAVPRHRAAQAERRASSLARRAGTSSRAEDKSQEVIGYTAKILVGERSGFGGLRRAAVDVIILYCCGINYIALYKRYKGGYDIIYIPIAKSIPLRVLTI